MRKARQHNPKNTVERADGYKSHMLTNTLQFDITNSSKYRRTLNL